MRWAGASPFAAITNAATARTTGAIASAITAGIWTWRPWSGRGAGIFHCRAWRAACAVRAAARATSWCSIIRRAVRSHAKADFRFTPIATDLVRCRQMTRWASNRLMHCNELPRSIASSAKSDERREIDYPSLLRDRHVSPRQQLPLTGCDILRAIWRPIYRTIWISRSGGIGDGCPWKV